MKKLNFKNHNHKPVTGGINGYPEPELGVVIFFNDEEQLATIEEEIGNNGLVEAHWRDGWHFCENNGSVNSILDYKKSVFEQIANDNTDFEDLSEFSVEKFKEEKMKQHRVGKYDDIDEDWRESYDEVLEMADGAMASAMYMGNNGLEFLYFDNGYSDDTHNYRLGLFFSREDFKINWETYTIQKRNHGK